MCVCVGIYFLAHRHNQITEKAGVDKDWHYTKLIKKKSDPVSCGMSFRDSEAALPLQSESETPRMMSVHSASDREMGWQEPQCAARSPTAIWAPVSDTVETINLQLMAEPSWGF